MSTTDGIRPGLYRTRVWRSPSGEHLATYLVGEKLEEIGIGFISSGADIHRDTRLATPEEIATYEQERAEYKARIEAHDRARAEKLSEFGLAPSDFCRLRDVSIELNGDVETLSVCTRENGVGGRSEGLYEKQGTGVCHVVETDRDEGDPTYQWYRIRKGRKA